MRGGGWRGEGTDLGECSVLVAFWDEEGLLRPLGLLQGLAPLQTTLRLAGICNTRTAQHSTVTLSRHSTQPALQLSSNQDGDITLCILFFNPKQHTNTA